MAGQRSLNVSVAAPHRTPPPDYASRSMKLRLFVALASIMLVAALVERSLTVSRQPTEPAEKPFDNRLPSNPRTSHDPVGTFVAAPALKPDASPGDAATTDPVARTIEQGWKDVFSRLTDDERDRLFALVDAASQRKAQPLPASDSTPELLSKIGRLWDEYTAAARASLSDASEADRTSWTAVLDGAAGRFDRQLGLLKEFTDGRALLHDETVKLEQLQSSLAAIARLQIQDDTPILRPAERQIWLHELARLRRQPADGPADETPSQVGYLQLSRQPADYRGKMVSIKGNVRRAYRSAAMNNYLSIKEYCVYWLHPAGGPDSPIVVYALDVPPGFPQLAKNAQTAGKPLHEDVEITGLFFKRCAYAGQGGTYTAPLLLADKPVWQPSPPPFASAPSPNLIYELGGAVLAALVIALCVTAVLWKRSASARPRGESLSAASLVNLSHSTNPTSPNEYLRTLQNKEGQNREGQNEEGGGK